MKENLEQLSDEELMIKCRDGDIHSFDLLVTRHKHLLTNFCYKYLNNYESAKEITQETFLTIYKKRKEYKISAKFTTWLLTIARRYCFDALRKIKRHPVISLELSGIKENIITNKSKSIEDKMLEEETNALLKNAVERLSDIYKEIVIMRCFEKLPYEEISKILGVSTVAVRKRMEYALNKLKKIYLKL